MQEVQELEGFLSQATIVTFRTDQIPAAEIYGVATLFHVQSNPRAGTR
jgi:NADH:ubiquinone oxidoreductase subunit E